MRRDRDMEIRVTLQFSRFISIGRILSERYVVGQISGREIHEMYFFETRIIADRRLPFFFFFSNSSQIFDISQCSGDCGRFTNT